MEEKEEESIFYQLKKVSSSLLMEGAVMSYRE